MKRRRERERDESDARAQAETRREALLAELRARQAAQPPAGGDGTAPTGADPEAPEPAA